MVVTTTPDFLRYWGKAIKSDRPIKDSYHLLPYHCLDVAACGYYIVKKTCLTLTRC